MNALGLREEMGGRPDPEFEMSLPPGWQRHGVDDHALQHMLGGVKKRLMRAHSPVIYAEFKVVLERAFQDMRRNGAVAFFSATEPESDTLWIPASIIASVRRADAGSNLDDLARTLIRSHGATPLRGDKRILRVEKEETIRVGTESVVNHSMVYFTPMPGTSRRRALQLVAGFGVMSDVSADAPTVTALKVLFDSCVSSLRWRVPDRQG